MSLNHDSALLLAVTKGELLVVKYLLETGADVNTRGGAVLVIATEGRDLTMVRSLYSQGARNNDALITALDREYEEIVEFFIDMLGTVSIPRAERLRFIVSSRDGMWKLVAKYS